MREERKTLTRYTIECEHRHPGSTGDFSGLLNAVATAVKIISNQVGRGALAGTLGSAGMENVQGEVQKKLDLISNEVMVGETEWTGHLAAMASEEMEAPAPSCPPGRREVPPCLRSPRRIVEHRRERLGGQHLLDPARAGPALEHACDASAFLQPGAAQVAAGYAIYGPSTMFVLSVGNGVHAFTLERSIGEFLLTHRNLRIPERTSEFAINSSNSRFWEPPVRRYVAECLAGASGPRGRDFNMRWIASLAAEAHRILMRGGVFLYPRDRKDPIRPGRLRLLYEANPVGFLVEQAGGRASTGRTPILEVAPQELHQRIPFVFGSREEVERIERYHAEDTGDADLDLPLFNTRGLFRDPVSA